jgi:hypothetical protein
VEVDTLVGLDLDAATLEVARGQLEAGDDQIQRLAELQCRGDLLQRDDGLVPQQATLRVRTSRTRAWWS